MIVTEKAGPRSFVLYIDEANEPVTDSLYVSGRCNWGESVASARRTDLQVKWSVFGMAAIVEEGFWSLFAVVNLDQRWGCWMRLAKVSTKSALT